MAYKKSKNSSSNLEKNQHFLHQTQSNSTECKTLGVDGFIHSKAQETHWTLNLKHYSQRRGQIKHQMFQGKGLKFLMQV